MDGLSAPPFVVLITGPFISFHEITDYNNNGPPSVFLKINVSSFLLLKEFIFPLVSSTDSKGSLCFELKNNETTDLGLTMIKSNKAEVEVGNCSKTFNVSFPHICSL